MGVTNCVLEKPVYVDVKPGLTCTSDSKQYVYGIDLANSITTTKVGWKAGTATKGSAKVGNVGLELSVIMSIMRNLQRH